MAETTQAEKIPKGAIFVVSVGTMEDYEVVACCKALREIDPAELQREYRRLHPKQPEDPDFQEGLYQEFPKALVWCEEQGYLEKLPFRELSLGSWHYELEFSQVPHFGEGSKEA